MSNTTAKGDRGMECVLKRGILLSSAFFISAVLALGLFYLNRGVLPAEEKQPTVIAVESLIPANITLPCAVENTGLIAKALCVYDGTFREQGSAVEVFGITALLLENTTDQLISSAEVKLKKDEEIFSFFVEMLPAGAVALVPERDGKSTPIKNFTHCSGWAKMETAGTNAVTVSSSGMGSYIVQNLTDQKISSICIWHKDYLKEANIYIGGVAYCTAVKDLQPRQKIEVYPLGYAEVASRVIAVIQDEK